MALCTLIHASSIDWSDTTYWKGGSVPANGDDVIIPRSVQGTITAGLAQSAVTLNSLIIEDGASPKTQGTLEINTGILTWYGNSSSFRLDGDVTQADLLGQSGIYVDGGSWTRTYIESGDTWFSDQVDLEPGSGTQDFTMVGGAAQVEAHASKRIPFGNILGGLLITKRDIEQAFIGAARAMLLDGASVADGSSGGLLTVASPKAMVHFEHDDDGLTIDALDGLAGTVDWSKVNGNVTISGNAKRSAAFHHTEQWGASYALTISGTAVALGPPGTSKTFKAKVA